MPGVDRRADRLRATFMRGGTSKGLMFSQADLPARDHWDALFLAALGSPDPYGRQLNGMGGGISSLSKICVVGPASRPDADVDYTFGQVLVSEARIDYAGNCGNMSAAVGPFAVLRGLVAAEAGERASTMIHNTNTGKLIRSTFAMRGGEPAFGGDFAIDGVAGGGSPIRLDFIEPGGSKTAGLLPTGNPTDMLAIAGHSVRASLVDAANPCIFVDATDLGLSAPMSPLAMDGESALLDRLEELRRAASLRMGLAATEEEAGRLGSIPKIAVVFAPADHAVLDGRVLRADDADIVVRMISMGKTHRALPITGAICLAAALRIPGSVPARLGRIGGTPLRIAHGSGMIAVDAEVVRARDGSISISHGSVLRTARRLFEGEVFC